MRVWFKLKDLNLWKKIKIKEKAKAHEEGKL